MHELQSPWVWQDLPKLEVKSSAKSRTNTFHNIPPFPRKKNAPVNKSEQRGVNAKRGGYWSLEEMPIVGRATAE